MFLIRIKVKGKRVQVIVFFSGENKWLGEIEMNTVHICKGLDLVSLTI